MLILGKKDNGKTITGIDVAEAVLHEARRNVAPTRSLGKRVVL